MMMISVPIPMYKGVPSFRRSRYPGTGAITPLGPAPGHLACGAGRRKARADLGIQAQDQLSAEPVEAVRSGGIRRPIAARDRHCRQPARDGGRRVAGRAPDDRAPPARHRDPRPPRRRCAVGGCAPSAEAAGPPGGCTAPARRPQDRARPRQRTPGRSPCAVAAASRPSPARTAFPEPASTSHTSKCSSLPPRSEARRIAVTAAASRAGEGAASESSASTSTTTARISSRVGTNWTTVSGVPSAPRGASGAARRGSRASPQAGPATGP